MGVFGFWWRGGCGGGESRGCGLRFLGFKV